jgi:hypothetical protein
LFLNLAERLQLLKLAKVTKALFPIEAGHRSRPHCRNALSSANRRAPPNGGRRGENAHAPKRASAESRPKDFPRPSIQPLIPPARAR